MGSVKKEYQISLVGCDDTTTMFIELTDKELALLQRVAIMSRSCSQSSCQPRMFVYALNK